MSKRARGISLFEFLNNSTNFIVILIVIVIVILIAIGNKILITIGDQEIGGARHGETQ